MLKTFIVVFVAFLMGCSSGEPKDFDVTEAGIKGLSPSIKKVKITPQIDPALVYVEMTIEKEPFTGSAQDWNSIAADVHHLSRSLLTKPMVTRARFEYVSPQNSGKAWAYVQWHRKDIPDNWNELTYLQFFSLVDPDGSYLQTMRWLCDFYKKYESAVPVSGMPRCDP